MMKMQFSVFLYAYDVETCSRMVSEGTNFEISWEDKTCNSHKGVLVFGYMCFIGFH